jgi:hypothetical protein
LKRQENQRRTVSRSRVFTFAGNAGQQRDIFSNKQAGAADIDMYFRPVSGYLNVDGR